MSLERVAREFARLNAGTCTDYESPVAQMSESETGSQWKPTWELLCGACQGLPRLPWLIGVYLWGGWDHVGGELLALIEGRGRQIGFEPGQAERAAALVLEEMSDPHCRGCQGRGIIYDKGGVVRDCPKCYGMGSRGMSNRERARRMSVSEGWYRQGVSERYRRLHSDVMRERDRAVAHVGARLFR